LPPSSLSDLNINVTDAPPRPHLSWKLYVYDGSMRFELRPVGNMWIQLAIFILLWTLPIITGSLSVWLYIQSFYKVKFNRAGAAVKPAWTMTAVRRARKALNIPEFAPESQFIQKTGVVIGSAPRRRVLIATMEYNIDDWQIKVKIGGLGVMAELMGRNLAHQDLIWVIPCVGGVTYPVSIFSTKSRIMAILI
jgi:alpha-1,3-glucan synthase